MAAIEQSSACYELDQDTVDKLRKMTAAERVALCSRLNTAFRAGLNAVIRILHQDWTETQIKREVARRMLVPEPSIDVAICATSVLSKPCSQAAFQELLEGIANGAKP